jgi:hypothetical protein
MKLNENLVRLICTTMTALRVYNAEQDILLPWRRDYAINPTAANLNVLAKVYKQPDNIRRAVDMELAKAGNLADQTLVGHAA